MLSLRECTLRHCYWPYQRIEVCAPLLGLHLYHYYNGPVESTKFSKESKGALLTKMKIFFYMFSRIFYQFREIMKNLRTFVKGLMKNAQLNIIKLEAYTPFIKNYIFFYFHRLTLCISRKNLWQINPGSIFGTKRSIFEKMYIV